MGAAIETRFPTRGRSRIAGAELNDERHAHSVPPTTPVTRQTFPPLRSRLPSSRTIVRAASPRRRARSSVHWARDRSFARPPSHRLTRPGRGQGGPRVTCGPGLAGRVVLSGWSLAGRSRDRGSGPPSVISLPVLVVTVKSSKCARTPWPNRRSDMGMDTLSPQAAVVNGSSDLRGRPRTTPTGRGRRRGD
jgi:hypothetical protein